MQVFIIYDSKYGNTKIVAENILEGLKQAEGIEADIGYAKEVGSQRLVWYDALIIGAPNHMGRPSRTMNKFIDRLAELDLKAKNVAVFGTYSGRIRPVDRAVKKLEKKVEKLLPYLRPILPSLSIRVRGVSGPVVDGELSKCKDFGRRIAHKLIQEK
jgi:menaquinone-dependent protoporphyrinogen IX oxidase